MEQASNSMRSAHTIEELLSLYDTSFVECAYWTILGRKVDPSGLRNYLIQVRKGVSKGQIVAELVQSSEGRARAIELPGITELLQAHKPRSRTWLGRLFRRTASQAHQELEMQLRSLENCVGILANEMSTRYEKLDAVWSEVSACLRQHAAEVSACLRQQAALKAELLTHYSKLDAAGSEVSTLVRQQAEFKSEMAELKTELQRLTLCFAWPSTRANPILEGSVDRDRTPRISIDQLMPNVLQHANRIDPKVPFVPSATGI
jgi:chaperonin cofactor prefoldin